LNALLIRNARTLTMCDGTVEALRPPTARRGRELGYLGIVEKADVLITDGVISQVSAAGRLASASLKRALEMQEIEAAGRVLMPGFVDCHTHTCWAGSRIDEWEHKLAGATYLEIMASGGGIMSTVRAVRSASEDGLVRELDARLQQMLRLGTTTVEVKSGYGLTAEHELKMLRAIERVAKESRATVSPTALLGHALEGEGDAAKRFVDSTIGATLDAVHQAFPDVPIDAYCEKGAWSVEECVRLFERAKSLGHRFRVHADQFNELGMIEAAAELGALSVDHLEASSRETLAALARTETFGVMLPACGFHLDGRYADGRGFLDAGGLLAIATNRNPGSAPCASMAMIIALATRHLRLTPAEAIGAATVNPARLLGFTDRGHIAPGARADLLLLRHTDERALGYEFGDNPIDLVVSAGQIVRR
jgi:imidazolonepropionase